MKINPIQGVEGANVVFKGFPTSFHHKAPNTIHSAYVRPERPVDGILLREHPEAPEGAGEKLDIIA